MTLSRGQIVTWLNRPSGWYHLVINYIGENDGQIFHVYQNSALMANATTLQAVHYGYRLGEGRIVIGQHFTRSYHHSSAIVDELILFEQMLSTQQMTTLSQYTTAWVKYDHK